MRVVCPWCAREGRPAFLREAEPLDDPSETHGVCRRHQLEVLAEVPSRSFPGVELLLVVRPRETALYDHLARTFSGLTMVRVIVDRRRGERRQRQTPATEERRRRDRRLRPGEVYAMGYTSVRFGRGLDVASTRAD